VSTVFPVILDVDRPEFFELLETCSDLNCALINLEKEETPEVLKTLQNSINCRNGIHYYECIVYQQLKQNTFGQKINLIRINFTIFFFLIDIKII
jgi:hypothetical protein